jgi:hypothetical protein
MKEFFTSNLHSQVAKSFMWIVLSLQVLIQHLRERITVTCWFGFQINPLKAELNHIRHLLALAGDRHFVDVSRIRVKALGYGYTELVSGFRFKNPSA